MALGKSKTHATAETKYMVLRNIVYERMAKDFPSLSFKKIDFSTCKVADHWKSPQEPDARGPRSGWVWSHEYPCYLRRPTRFEISVWSDSSLLALSLGQLSRYGTRVRLNLIESTPIRSVSSSQKAVPLVLRAATYFAGLVNASEVWVVDPAPSLESYYESAGFGKRERFHCSRLGQRRIL